MTEKIGVTYRAIDVGPFGTGGYHMAIFYTNSQGQTKVIEVGPSIDPPGPIPLTEAALQQHYSGSSDTVSPFGRIAGGERDWSKADELLPQDVLTQGEDLSSEWNSIKSTLGDVMSNGYEYQGPFDQNSNTFVRDAIKNASIRAPDGIATDINGNTSAYWTPGASNLSNPINGNKLSSGSGLTDTKQLSPPPSGGSLVLPANTVVTPQSYPQTPAPFRWPDGSPAQDSSPEPQGLGGVLKYTNDATTPLSAQQLAQLFPYPPGVDNATPDAASAAPPIRYLARRVVDNAGNPVMPSTVPPQPSPPFGLFTGRPMPDWPVPPPIFDSASRSGASDGGDSSDDTTPRGTGIPFLDDYIRYLNQTYPG